MEALRSDVADGVWAQVRSWTFCRSCYSQSAAAGRARARARPRRLEAEGALAAAAAVAVGLVEPVKPAVAVVEEELAVAQLAADGAQAEEAGSAPVNTIEAMMYFLHAWNIYI